MEIKRRISFISVGLFILMLATLTMLQRNTDTVFAAIGYETSKDGCGTKLDDQPYMYVRFTLNEKTNQVLMTVKGIADGYKDSLVFDDCKVFDRNNWRCGGKIWVERGFAFKDDEYALIDGRIIKYEPFERRSSSSGEIQYQRCGIEYRRAGLISALMF